jgi:1-acyl-sn-glycerol-3-phosphate acyltransferase
MIATLRMALALAMVGLTTVVLVPLQWVGMKTGLFRDSLLPNLFHKVATRALGIRVRVVGEMAKERPLLLVPNHISWSDITILGSVEELYFVARADMATWPVVGLFSRMQRSVFVERESKRKAGDQANELAERLASDVVVLFAEGTTGDGNFLLPFKSTLFGAARNAISHGGFEKVTVQPVAITYPRMLGLPVTRRERARLCWIGDTDLGPHLKGLLRMGALDVTVRFGEPVEFTGSSDRKTITRVTEQRVRAMLAEDLANRRAA